MAQRNTGTSDEELADCDRGVAHLTRSESIVLNSRSDESPPPPIGWVNRFARNRRARADARSQTTVRNAVARLCNGGNNGETQAASGGDVVVVKRKPPPVAPKPLVVMNRSFLHPEKADGADKPSAAAAAGEKVSVAVQTAVETEPATVETEPATVETEPVQTVETEPVQTVETEPATVSVGVQTSETNTLTRTVSAPELLAADMSGGSEAYGGRSARLRRDATAATDEEPEDRAADGEDGRDRAAAEQIGRGAAAEQIGRGEECFLVCLDLCTVM